jgi:hypothetical protein
MKTHEQPEPAAPFQPSIEELVLPSEVACEQCHHGVIFIDNGEATDWCACCDGSGYVLRAPRHAAEEWAAEVLP